MNDSFGDWALTTRIKSGRNTGVWFARNSAGLEGVLKYCQASPSAYVQKRFQAEVKAMLLLKGEAGVLPLIDADPTNGRRQWMVTAKAQLLVPHLGLAPGFRDVVACFATYAETLARLQDSHGLAHRDLKPDNLFWLSEPVLGDFGIARLPQDPSLTRVDDKLGPWGFIAPEALQADPGVNWHAADVYSIAKCLWAVAAGSKYPIQGTLFIREEATSLYGVGGNAALELGRLLEMATAHRAHKRPRMSQLRDELHLWLSQHSARSVQRPPTRGSRVTFTSFPDLLARRDDAGGPERITETCTRELLDLLRSLRPATSEVHNVDHDAVTADLHDFGISDPDWEPDAVATLALTWPDEPRTRLVAQGIADGPDDIRYLAQWQQYDGDTWQPATILRYGEAPMRLPSDMALRSHLALSLTADDPGPPPALSLPRPPTSAASWLRRLSKTLLARKRDNQSG